MPINSNEPIFLAANVFMDTLLEVGYPPKDAETARTAFYALKKDQEEET